MSDRFDYIRGARDVGLLEQDADGHVRLWLDSEAWEALQRLVAGGFNDHPAPGEEHRAVRDLVVGEDR